MTQMPLWGEPDPPRTQPRSEAKITFTKHTGQPTTCHLCIIDVARGEIHYERDLASHVIRWGTRSWLSCRAHTREVRERASLLEKYRR